jgi:hypothetical protein
MAIVIIAVIACAAFHLSAAHAHHRYRKARPGAVPDLAFTVVEVLSRDRTHTGIARASPQTQRTPVVAPAGPALTL